MHKSLDNSLYLEKGDIQDYQYMNNNYRVYFKNNLEDLIDEEKEKNETINSKKVLIELKGKVDSQSSKNYCYLDNKNEKGKYDLSKYKLNCVVPTFENEDNKLKFYNLFSKYYILNFLSQKLFNDKLYCFKEKNYITAFYFYSDECTNTFYNIINYLGKILNNILKIQSNK